MPCFINILKIKERGGQCVPVQVDHEDDKQIESLFKKIQTEENGRLDLLVNNAFKGGKAIFDNLSLDFWETEPAKMWDDINNTGLR
jgi:NAD(P)-dependent dehydrogenase (short-subunit alcohol dehydrogenase family)